VQAIEERNQIKLAGIVFRYRAPEAEINGGSGGLSCSGGTVDRGLMIVESDECAY
jgi:hypothetical protein